MKPVVAGLANEVQKLMAKKLTLLFLIVAALLPILINLLINNLFITDWMALPAENINYSILDFFVKIMLPLFTFIAAADLFTGEAERGTLFQIRPIERIELFFSKTAAIGSIIGVQLLLGFLSVLISSIFVDMNFLFNDVLTLFMAFVLSWIPLMVLTAFAVLFALLFKSSVIAVSTMITGYLAMIVLPYLFPNLLYLLPTSYLDWYMQWLGDISIGWVTQSLAYIGSAFALFLALAYSLFEKKEA